jgi:hypothetical protein
LEVAVATVEALEARAAVLTDGSDYPPRMPRKLLQSYVRAYLGIRELSMVSDTQQMVFNALKVVGCEGGKQLASSQLDRVAAR